MDEDNRLEKDWLRKI